MPSPIRIVLIDTSHPGNIGAAARAMKNMGLQDLVLVRPKEFPSAEATARASGAEDVLLQASVVQTLDEGIAGCSIIAGATARTRMHYWKMFDAREAAQKLIESTLAPEPPSATVKGETAAVLFGSERFGLSNEEISRCNWLIRIPANPEYESLNLAQAVQIVCYELYLASGAGIVAAERESPLATSQQMQYLYEHLEQVLGEIGFADRTQSGGHLMGRLKRLFNRAQLDSNELNILRGILTAVQNRRRPAGDT